MQIINGKKLKEDLNECILFWKSYILHDLIREFIYAFKTKSSLNRVFKVWKFAKTRRRIMGFTKKTVTFFLVVLLAVSLFTQNDMVSAGMSLGISID